jgi:heterodisulfide reductase subunit A-like polyferredoxin
LNGVVARTATSTREEIVGHEVVAQLPVDREASMTSEGMIQMSHETFVIVGASVSGAAAAAELRKQGFDGRIVLVGEEAERPYERPNTASNWS